MDNTFSQVFTTRLVNGKPLVSFGRRCDHFIIRKSCVFSRETIGI